MLRPRRRRRQTRWLSQQMPNVYRLGHCLLLSTAQEVSDDEEEAEAKEAAEGEVEEVKPEDEAKEKKVSTLRVE